MTRILILTDRPQADDRLFSRVAETARKLSTQSVAVVVTRGNDVFLTAGYSFSVPDSGIVSPHSLSLLAFSPDRSDIDLTTQFLARCQEAAAFSGLSCETAISNTSLRLTAGMLADAFGLIVATRETLLGQGSQSGSLQSLWEEVKSPWLVYPASAEPWKRIVVACRRDAPSQELTAWGEHWSERFGLPLTSIESVSLRPSLRTIAANWRAWCFPNRFREAVRKGLYACGLGPGDLLLVDRESLTWPFLTSGGEVSLGDLVAVAPCAIGVAPAKDSTFSFDLLFPRGVGDVNKHEPKIAVA